MEEEEKLVAWLLNAVPWTGCPFDLKLVVATNGGAEDAKRIFRKFYQNDNLEIKDCSEIAIINAKMFDELIKKEEKRLNGIN